MPEPTQPAWPTGRNAAAHEHLRGKVERHDGGLLVGWLLDPAAPAMPVVFDLFVNDQPAGRHFAEFKRADLAAKGIGTGKYGFRAPVPAGLLKAETNQFRLVAVASGLAVEASFAAPPAPPAAPTVATEMPPVVEAPAAPAIWPDPALFPPQLVAAAAPADPGAGLQPAFLEVVPAAGAAEAGPAVPADPAARRALAAELAARRDWAAVLQVTEALPSDPATDAALLVVRARALLALGQAEQAETELRAALDQASPDPTLVFELGIALERQQRHLEAAGVYARCKALAPQDGRYLMQLARALAQAANGGNGAAPDQPELLADAIALAEEATAMMARDGRPCRDLARMLYQTGEFERALAAIREAERRQPSQPSFPMEQARILVRLDRIEEAVTATARAVRLDPANDAAVSALRVLERWAAARRSGPWKITPLAGAGGPGPATPPAT